VLTRFARIQLMLFMVLTLATVIILGGYYLRLPSLAGIGQYTLTADLPASGGLYRTANVTYRGATIGKVTDVKPTADGARATLSIDDRYKIPVDATANVHSVSAIGEQYIDLVSEGNSHQYLSNGQTIVNGTVPQEIGPALDAAERGLSALPKDKIALLLNETSEAVGGLGPTLQRLVNATQSVVGDFRTNLQAVNDIINNSAPILDSQVNSSDAVKRWAANLNSLAAQSANEDQALRNALSKAAPTSDAVTEVFSNMRDALPQTLANLEVVFDLLKRYNNGVEQLLVVLPQTAATLQASTAPYPNFGLLDFHLSINQPPPCLTGFLPASQWRSPADTSTAPLPSNIYCKIPKDAQNVVRGARNYPCADVPGKRAATPAECRSRSPYVPAGTNPWYGDPNQILSCPAPGARCDQAVKPGFVQPAPSVNNGTNPLPADRVPGTPPPVSDPLSRPRGGSVQCNGQQPNPCTYTGDPSPGTAVYSPQTEEAFGPNGIGYTVVDSRNIGQDGWKDMLAPAG
jgi:phospholipid/cholesterol/gamma-HCH transport system substrate-binding protein